MSKGDWALVLLLAGSLFFLFMAAARIARRKSLVGGLTTASVFLGAAILLWRQIQRILLLAGLDDPLENGLILLYGILPFAFFLGAWVGTLLGRKPRQPRA